MIRRARGTGRILAHWLAARRLLPLSVAALVLLGCSPALETDQARLVPHGSAGADSGRRADLDRSATARSGRPWSQRRFLGRGARTRTPEPHVATCRFREPGRPRESRDLVLLTLDGAPLSDTQLHFLVRYWLSTPEGRAADPAPLGDVSGALRLPRRAAYGVQMALDGLPLSAIYALLAAAYSLVYGLIGRINFAFGELAAAGGYAAAMTALALAGLPPAPLLAAAFALAAVVAAGWGYASARCGLPSAASRQGPAGAGRDRRPRPLPAGAPATRPGRPDELDEPAAQPAFRRRPLRRLHRRRHADDLRGDGGRRWRSASGSSSSSAGPGRDASGAPTPTIRWPPNSSA